MAELIVAADAADAVRLHLAAAMPDVECTAGTTPTQFAERSINTVRVGGYQRDLVTDVATVSLDYRHTSSEAAAEELARLADAHLHAAERDGALGHLICHEVTTLAAPYLNPDPVNPSVHRVSASYQVAVRMTTV